MKPPTPPPTPAALTASSHHMSLQMPSLWRPPSSSSRPSLRPVMLWHMRSHGPAPSASAEAAATHLRRARSTQANVPSCCMCGCARQMHICVCCRKCFDSNLMLHACAGAVPHPLNVRGKSQSRACRSRLLSKHHTHVPDSQYYTWSGAPTQGCQGIQ